MDVSCLSFMYMTGLCNECCTHKSQHRCASVFEFHNFLSFAFVIFWTVCVHNHEHEVFSFFNRSILLIKNNKKKREKSHKSQHSCWSNIMWQFSSLSCFTWVALKSWSYRNKKLQFFFKTVYSLKLHVFDILIWWITIGYSSLTRQALGGIKRWSCGCMEHLLKTATNQVDY